MTETTSPHRLDGKTAVVTGAAQGLGLSMAEELAGEGADAIIADTEISRRTPMVAYPHRYRKSMRVCKDAVCGGNYGELFNARRDDGHIVRYIVLRYSGDGSDGHTPASVAPDARVLADQPTADLAVLVEVDHLFQLRLVLVIAHLHYRGPKKVPQQPVLEPQRVEARGKVAVLAAKIELAIVDRAQQALGLDNGRLDEDRLTSTDDLR